MIKKFNREATKDAKKIKEKINEFDPFFGLLTRNSMILRNIS